MSVCLSVCLYVCNILTPLPKKLFRLVSSLNSVEYEIGFRLEEFLFSVFFFIIHLLPKLNRLHLHSYGRWSSLFSSKTPFSPLRLVAIILNTKLELWYYKIRLLTNPTLSKRTKCRLCTSGQIFYLKSE